MKPANWFALVSLAILVLVACPMAGAADEPGEASLAERLAGVHSEQGSATLFNTREDRMEPKEPFGTKPSKLSENMCC